MPEGQGYSLLLGFHVFSDVPTVVRIDGFRVVIWSNDHRPAHVHVVGGGGEAVFNLHCPEGPPQLRESFGHGPADLNRIEQALTAALASLCDRWRALHGRH